MSAVPIEQTTIRPGAMASPQLRTLALCDLVESTALIEELGDQRAAELMRRLDRITRDLLHRHGGREIDKTDGFLVLFDRPIRAVAFALDYQRQLHDLGRAEFLPLRARIGIHVGDVMLWENEPSDVAQGAKPLEVEGLIKPVAARLMTLARPGQTLLSGIAYSLALRAQGELEGDQAAPIWKSHGNYRFKGVADPVSVYEVGMPGVAPLRAPPWSSKAHREVPWYRRPGMVVVEIAAVIAAISVPAYTFFRSPPAIAFANRDWVVVGDFKNLTGETTFDSSLQTAFRIGLEQSRYVNLLSDLKVRDSVQRMQRDPLKTLIDRTVGSEVAVREGARALILPTVAEVGGRVRITAEVIDPNTQATVYSESADGVGAPSLLPSIDKVNQQLRVRLGEALATVSKDSQPLEKVTTQNLDALKAYSLAVEKGSQGQPSAALELLRQALKLDPNFALAHITIGHLLYGGGQQAEAFKEFATGLAMSDHLTTRDKLFGEAFLATSQSPVAATEKLKLLTSLYPDYFRAQGVLSYIDWQYLNAYDDGIAAASVSASERNPHRITSQHLLAVLNLGNERYAEADREFSDVQSAGFAIAEYHAMLPAVKRQFDSADALLAKSKPSGSTQDLALAITRASMAVDRGNTQETKKILASATQLAQQFGATSVQRFSDIDLSVATLVQPKQEWIASLTNYINNAVPADPGLTNAERAAVDFQILFTAYLAARADDARLVDTAIAKASTLSSGAEFPVLAELRTIVEGEKERLAGHPELEIRRLKALVNGRELCILHLALTEAYAATGDLKSALNEAHWLATHRGRAYVEFNGERSLSVYNVAQTDLALLRAAELSSKLQKTDDAARDIQQFRLAWPDAAASTPIASRLAKFPAASMR